MIAADAAGQATAAPVPSVLYAAPACLFDPTSGASLSIRTLLGGIAGRGGRVAALQAMVFDAPEGGERVRALAAQHPEHRAIESEVDGVRHLILRTASTDRGAMTSVEEQAFYRRLRRELAERRPDFVLTWGSMLLERAIVEAARRVGIPVVFYLVNPQYLSNEAFEGVSLIVTDTDATARLYRERNGLDAVAVGKFVDPAPVTAPRRDPRVYTFVNPAVPKGASLFVALAARARSELPHARFLVIEGRGRWLPALRALGHRADDFPNVEVIGPQRDMRAVYARTRALLLPSLWHESGSRLIVEALINGIPVLASDTGGSAELLGDGGFLFPVPQAVREHPQRPVDDTVIEPWLAMLARLQDDDAFYAQCCDRARHAAQPHAPERSVQRLLDALAPLRAPRDAGPSAER